VRRRLRSREGEERRNKKRKRSSLFSLLSAATHRSWQGRSRTSRGCGRRRACRWPVCVEKKKKKGKGKGRVEVEEVFFFFLRGSKRPREREQKRTIDNRKQRTLFFPLPRFCGPNCARRRVLLSTARPPIHSFASRSAWGEREKRGQEEGPARKPKLKKEEKFREP
jgi:hypothetical protein